MTMEDNKKGNSSIEAKTMSQESSTSEKTSVNSSEHVVPPPRKKRVVRRVPRKKTPYKEEAEPQFKTGKKGRNPDTMILYTKLATGALGGVFIGVLRLLVDTDITMFAYLFVILLILASSTFIRYILKVTEDEVSSGMLLAKGSFSLFIAFILVSTLVWEIGYVYLLGKDLAELVPKFEGAP